MDIAQSFCHKHEAKSAIANKKVKIELFSEFVNFFNILLENFKEILKKLTKLVIQINTKAESNCWKNEPNSIYFAAEYNGNNSSVSINPSNRNNNIATLISKNVQDNTIDVIATCFNFSGFFKTGGMKKIYANPCNTNILPKPETNVAYKPFPSIGYILSISKN